tara:strand:- start:2679 stop:3650 length:972 start_codon:yes stop_codon:yes gene_type:complete
MGCARAQIELNFGQFDTRVTDKSFLDNGDLKLNKPTIILEKSLDPNNYIIGPGDVFGININTMEKMFFPTTVGPVGDLLIPGVGSVSISGVNLKNSIQLIKDRISNTYNNADIGVSLIDLKTFKIQIYGAVINPGFAEIQATTRLDAAIEKLGGLHRYADEENISIISSKGAIAIISLKAYLIDGNLDNNPQLYEGDKINLPYLPSHINEFKNNVTFKRVPVLVTGFVNLPGPINYFPGYSVKDYIGLAGGVSELGNVKKVYLIRNDIKSKINNNEIVIPGDHIIVPEGTFSVLFGKNSFLQNLTALFSIISTYTIISDRLGN